MNERIKKYDNRFLIVVSRTTFEKYLLAEYGEELLPSVDLSNIEMGGYLVRIPISWFAPTIWTSPVAEARRELVRYALRVQGMSGGDILGILVD